MAFARRVRRLVNPRTRAVAKRRKNPTGRSRTHKRRLTAAQIKAGFGGKRRQTAAKRRRKSNPPKVRHRRRTTAARRNPKPKLRVVTRYKTRIVTRNPKRRHKRRTNPVLLTFGPALMNPKRKRRISTVAKRRKRSKNPRRAAAHRRRRVSNPVKVVYRYKARRRRTSNPRRRRRTMIPRRRTMRRRNPINFGSGHGAVSTAKAVAAGLVGVTITKTIVGMLPASVTSSPIMRVIASGAAAWGAGFLATKMMGSDVGGAVMFGGFMQAGSMALNAFAPQIGGVIGLNGLRGLTPSKDILLPYNMFGGMQGQFPAPGPMAGGGFTPAFAN